MAQNQERYTFDRVVRIVLSVITLVAVFWLLDYLSDVLLPFAAAVVLAYLLNPLVSIFEQKTKRRSAAVAITIGGLAIVGLALVAIILPLMASQIGRFQDNLHKLRDDVAASIQKTSVSTPPAQEQSGDAETSEGETEKTALGLRELTDGWVAYRKNPDAPRSERFATLYEAVAGTYVGDLIDRARRYTESDEFDQLLLDTAKRLALGGWTVVTFVLNVVLGLTGLIVVLLYLIFLLLDYPEYAKTWQTFLPPQYRESIVEFLEQFDLALRRYLRGQAVVALVVGALMAVGFTIIGLPMALPFGLFVGLLNMVPYLQTVAVIPAVMLAGLRAVEGDSSFTVSVILALAVMGIVQLIQDSLITPRIVGQSVGLKPVAILLGVCVWGKLLGFLGLVLAIPLTCLGIAYYRRFVLLHTAVETLPPEET